MKLFWQVVATVLVVGCSSTSTPAPADPPPTEDSTPAEVDDAGADTAPVCAAKLAGACGDCMKTSCCDALTACEKDTNCQACVTGKDTTVCEATAATQKRVNAYLVCKGGACKVPCIGAAGGACAGLLDGSVTPTCQGCLEGKCCDEVAACHSQATCWDGCFNNFNETKCHGDPDGHAAFHALGACVSTSCAAECN
jgi:hypothetical protein